MAGFVLRGLSGCPTLLYCDFSRRLGYSCKPLLKTSFILFLFCLGQLKFPAGRYKYISALPGGEVNPGLEKRNSEVLAKLKLDLFAWNVAGKWGLSGALRDGTYLILLSSGTVTIGRRSGTEASVDQCSWAVICPNFSPRANVVDDCFAEESERL